MDRIDSIIVECDSVESIVSPWIATSGDDILKEGERES